MQFNLNPDINTGVVSLIGEDKKKVVEQALSLYFDKVKRVEQFVDEAVLDVFIVAFHDIVLFTATHGSKTACAGSLRVIENEGEDSEVMKIIIGINEPKVFYYNKKRDQVFMRRRGF